MPASCNNSHSSGMSGTLFSVDFPSNFSVSGLSLCDMSPAELNMQDGLQQIGKLHRMLEFEEYYMVNV